MNKIFLSILLVSLIFISPVSALSFGEAFNNIIKNPFSKLFSNTEMTGESIKDITGEAIQAFPTQCFIGGAFIYSGCYYTRSWIVNNVEMDKFTIYTATGGNKIIFTRAIVETTNQGTKTITLNQQLGNGDVYLVNLGARYIVKRITLEVENKNIMVNAGVKYETGEKTCTDTDSTNDKSILGEVSDGIITIPDKCITTKKTTKNLGMAGSPTTTLTFEANICEPNIMGTETTTCRVKQYACDSNKNIIDVAAQDCPKGCSNGKCIEAVTTPAAQPQVGAIPFCLSDDGKKIPVGGRVKKLISTTAKYAAPASGISESPLTGRAITAIKAGSTYEYLYCEYDFSTGTVQLEKAKAVGELCDNNYECYSNYCRYGTVCGDVISEAPKATTITTAECLGCLDNNKCLPVGFRRANKYCPETKGALIDQIAVGLTCKNDYECVSNLCADAKCIDIKKYDDTISLIKQIFCKLNPTATECRIGMISAPFTTTTD